MDDWQLVDAAAFVASVVRLVKGACAVVDCREDGSGAVVAALLATSEGADGGMMTTLDHTRHSSSQQTSSR